MSYVMLALFHDKYDKCTTVSLHLAGSKQTVSQKKTKQNTPIVINAGM